MLFFSVQCKYCENLATHIYLAPCFLLNFYKDYTGFLQIVTELPEKKNF